METEQGTVIEEVAAPVPSGVEVAPADQEAETPSIPKIRFDEVLNRAKAAEQKSLQLEARLQVLERPAPAPAQQQPIPTLEQALAAYDKGQITEGQKDQWVYYHSVEGAAKKVGQAVAMAAEVGRSQATIADYVKAMPTLNDISSDDYKAYAMTQQELLAEGWQDGFSTRARALRMTFGRLKSGPASSGTDHTRERADTFVEGAGGGGNRMPAANDPLKDVPERQIKYWKSKGYSRDQMVSAAQMRHVGNVRDYQRLTAKKAK